MPTKIEQLAIEHMARAHGSTGDRPGELRTAIELKFPGAIARAAERAKKARFESRFEGDVPAWAKRFVKKYAPGLDLLRIRRSREKVYSSGHCRYYGPIVVTFSAPVRRVFLDEANQAREVERVENERKVVVLHELAHHRTPGHGHDEKFAAELHRLVVAERLTGAHRERHGRRRVLKGRRAATARP